MEADLCPASPAHRPTCPWTAPRAAPQDGRERPQATGGSANRTLFNASSGYDVQPMRGPKIEREL
eukprot:4720128-Alexandrium_andersonii.AAC.1